MSTPFPGMDPWLENPVDWPGFHDILIVTTVQILQPSLRARGYYAKPGERVWLTQPRRPVYPDVAVIRQRPRTEIATGGVAVVEPDEPIRIQHADVEVRETFVDIYDLHGNRLVTSIEILSPTNKSDADGREMYRRKQEESKRAGIHLVEVDLIRKGPHVLDVPEELVTGLPRWEYLVNLVRGGGTEYEIYAIRLREPLPRIRIPLNTGDEDATLDLQEAVNAAYRIGPYPESLDYQHEPGEPLEPDDAAWADEILRANGLR